MASMAPPGGDDHWFFYVTLGKYVFVPCLAYNKLWAKGWTDEEIVKFFADDKPTSEQLAALQDLLSKGKKTQAVGGLAPVADDGGAVLPTGQPAPKASGSGAVLPTGPHMSVPVPKMSVGPHGSRAPTTPPGVPPKAAAKAGRGITPPPAAAGHPAAPPLPSLESGGIPDAKPEEPWDPHTEDYSGYSSAGCNGMCHSAAEVQDYVQCISDVLEKRPVRGFTPENSFQFASIQDYVSTVRYEASQEGGAFQWPHDNISFEIGLGIALHHLPPGFMVTVQNGKPCPKSIAQSEYGDRLDYWHGTTCKAVISGILRHGLMPVFGAGAGNTKAAWGVPTPMVYLSRLVECATQYPGHPGLWRLANPGTKSKEPMNGGEIIARDGTPPMRVLLHCQAVPQRQLWHRKTQGTNDQRAFYPHDVYVSAISWYALQPEMASPAQLHYIWVLVTADGEQVVGDQLRPAPDAKVGEYPHAVAYGVLKYHTKPIPLDITKKNLLGLRCLHTPTLVISHELDRDDQSLPAGVLQNLFEWQHRVPVLERTTLHEKTRVEIKRMQAAADLGDQPSGAASGSGQSYQAGVTPTTLIPTSTTEPQPAAEEQHPARWEHFGRSGWFQQSWDFRSGWYSWFDNQRWDRHRNQWGWTQADDWDYYREYGQPDAPDTQDQTVAWTGQGSGDPKRRKTEGGDQPPSFQPNRNGNATAKWIKRCKKTYTRYVRLFIDLAYKPIFWDYYGADQGNYAPIAEGYTIQMDDVWPVPQNEYPHPDSFRYPGQVAAAAGGITPAAAPQAGAPASSSQAALTPGPQAQLAVQPSAYQDYRVQEEQARKKRADLRAAARQDYWKSWSGSSQSQKWVAKPQNFKNIGAKSTEVPPPAALGDQLKEPPKVSKKERLFADATLKKTPVEPMDPNAMNAPPKGVAAVGADWVLPASEIQEKYSKGANLLQKGVDKAAKKGAAPASNVLDDAATRRPLTTWFSRGAWKKQSDLVEENFRTRYIDGKPVRQTLDADGNVTDQVDIYEPPAGFPDLGESVKTFTKPSVEGTKKKPSGAYTVYASEEKRAEAEALEEQERLEAENKYVRTKKEEEHGDQPSSSSASSKPKEGSPPEAPLTAEDLGLSEQEIIDELRQIEEANLFCSSMWSVVSKIYTAENLTYETFRAQVIEKSAERSAELQTARDKLTLAKQEKAAADQAAEQALAAEAGAAMMPEEPESGAPMLCDQSGQSGIAIGDVGNVPAASDQETQEQQEAADELMVPPQPAAPAAAPPSEQSDPHSVTEHSLTDVEDSEMKGAVSLGSESDPPGDA